MSRRTGRARPGPVPLVGVLADVFRKLPPPDPEPGPPAAAGVVDPEAPPGRGPKSRGTPFVRLPSAVLSHPKLNPTAKLVYGALLSLCWGTSTATSETNARIRQALGGTSETFVFKDKLGRKRSRTRRRSGLSDDAIQRAISQLIAHCLVRREDDPHSFSTRRLVLLDLPAPVELPGEPAP